MDSKLPVFFMSLFIETFLCYHILPNIVQLYFFFFFFFFFFLMKAGRGGGGDDVLILRFIIFLLHDLYGVLW